LIGEGLIRKVTPGWMTPGQAKVTAVLAAITIWAGIAYVAYVACRAYLKKKKGNNNSPNN
jgi:hypothetical protein